MRHAGGAVGRENHARHAQREVAIGLVGPAVSSRIPLCGFRGVTCDVECES
jgi:hypothetical protein